MFRFKAYYDISVVATEKHYTWNMRIMTHFSLVADGRVLPSQIADVPLF